MAQQSTTCACVVELRKPVEADVSDDDSSSWSTCSGSPSESSSRASRTSISRSFVWADADSDDDLDVASFGWSAGGSNQHSVCGNVPSVPRIPPGCNQPWQVDGVGQRWAIVAVSPCAAPLVKQYAAWVPATRAQESRKSACRETSKQIAPRSPETAARPGSSLKSEASTDHFAIADDSRTTIVIRNLPAGCTQSGLCKILDEAGLAGLYNFVYVPFNFKGLFSLRYGFVNFERHENAVKAMATLDGFSGWMVDGEEACVVEWSGTQQGLNAHIERYRNSPVMHSSVPEEYKPVLFERGVRMEFPAPTQKLKPLKLRNSKQA